MLFKKIRRTLELNQTKIDFPGKKIYYDKVTLGIALAVYILFIILSLVLYSLDNQWWILLMIPLYLSFLPELIRKLLFRNPVFVFQKDKFYCTMENYWFDQKNSQSSYAIHGKTYIYISTLNDTISVKEVVMYLDDATEFRKEIAQYSSNKDMLTLIEYWSTKK